MCFDVHSLPIHIVQGESARTKCHGKSSIIDWNHSTVDLRVAGATSVRGTRMGGADLSRYPCPRQSDNRPEEVQ